MPGFFLSLVAIVTDGSLMFLKGTPFLKSLRSAYSFLQFCGMNNLGGGFFLACKNFGRMFDIVTIHSLPVLFFFFFKVDISLCTLIPLFTPG